jgi:hypothetical protein
MVLAKLTAALTSPEAVGKTSRAYEVMATEEIMTPTTYL